MKTALITLLFLAALSLHASKRPNIIVVFIDDMGWGDFSSFGNEDASTSNIDALAEEGIRFEQFYVNSPICSPSRVALSTGTYPQRWRVTSFLSHRAMNTKRGMAQWLDPKAPMLARTLQESGYATGHFGKWHMGGQRDVGEAPPITAYGFDASLTNFEGIGAKLLPLTILKNGEVGRIWEKEENTLGAPVTWMQRYEITGGFIDAAIPFMGAAKEAGKPFYVNIWPDDVHTPFFPSYARVLETKRNGDASDEDMKDRLWRKKYKRELYLAVLEEMDMQLGKLFDFVRKDPGLRENTLILVCSDNGPELGAGEAGKFKGYKTHLFEGGVRSPLIAWGPGVLANGVEGRWNRDSVFSAMDLVPSLVRLSGAKPNEGVEYDGEDVLDTLIGRSESSREAPLFFSRPPDRKSYYGYDNLPDLAARMGKWKLLCDYDGSRVKLYDLEQDPMESNDLAEKNPKVVKRLVSALMAWNESMPLDAGDPGFQ